MGEKKVREAIYCMKSFVDETVCEECNHYETCDHIRVEENAKIAIEALEKQLPKKPKKMKYSVLVDDGWKYKCPICGCACGENIYHYDITKDDMYCTNCGQKIY